jgi:hypothetical protein
MQTFTSPTANYYVAFCGDLPDNYNCGKTTMVAKYDLSTPPTCVAAIAGSDPTKDADFSGQDDNAGLWITYDGDNTKTGCSGEPVF